MDAHGAQNTRPFAEFTLSATNGLRVTGSLFADLTAVPAVSAPIHHDSPYVTMHRNTACGTV